MHVGEAFSLVLTCAVAETDALKVILDQASLDPSAPVARAVRGHQLGTTGRSEGAGDKRFSIQLQTAVDCRRCVRQRRQGAGDHRLVPAATARRRRYVARRARSPLHLLPAQPIRILSLVPIDAPDIRDGASEMFGDIDDRSFHASALLVVAGVLFALAGLAALVLFARLLRAAIARRPADASRRPPMRSSCAASDASWTISATSGKRPGGHRH